MSEDFLGGEELRIRNLEALMMVQTCELRVHRKIIASMFQDNAATLDGKTLNDYFWDALEREKNALLASLSDIDPNRASWLAGYIEKQMPNRPKSE